MQDQELDLRELLYVLRRRLLLIVALPVVAAVMAGLVSQFLITPIYEASTTLWVIKDDAAQISYNDLLLSRNLTKTYAEVAQSRTVLADVIQRLGLAGMTVEDLQEKLTVTAVRDTELLSFTVEDADPARAARLADAVAASFMRQIHSFMKVENVAVVDPALVPTDPVSPRKAMNVAVAFVLGGMLAVALAFLLEYLDTSVRTPEDVQRHLGLPVLATIPVFEAKAEPEPAVSRTRVRKRAVGERRAEL